MLAAGCDAGIRYDERLEQDMIAVPIGPRQQRFSLGAAPSLSRSTRQTCSTRAICSAIPVCKAGFRAGRRWPGSSSATVKSSRST